MSEEDPQPSRRRQRTRTAHTETDYGPPPSEVHHSIRNLRNAHRAAHPDSGTKLEGASHLLMASEWPINCPRFMEGLQMSGMNCVSQLQYIRLDHHLLTALVERWSPQTNSFHFPVGEMSITLQDVAMILGVQIDGPPLVGHPVVGVGKRWQSWPDCCDDLLGKHPIEDFVYHDPSNPTITSKFRMGQARAQTCLPLRWLRWMFCRDSYIDLNEVDFHRHIRAYILFMLGCFLLPDTSGSEIHLQYLPLLEDLPLFSTYSLGSAVLGLLYRELCEGTKPRRTNMAGCLHLLQIWSWEHLHVGRPTLIIPYPDQLERLSVGSRWNEKFVRETPTGSVKQYRDDLDGLLQSQVIWMPYQDVPATIDFICLTGSEIWRSRVPLISWTRVEWHLPDRVLRQFGLLPRIDMPPMESNFQRTDGRGKVGVDFAVYHHRYISLWENRRSYVVHGGETEIDGWPAVTKYMNWYRSWASLQLLSAPTEAPTSYYPCAPTEIAFREYFLNIEETLQPFFGFRGIHPSELERAIDRCEEFSSSMRRRMYIEDTRYQDMPEYTQAGNIPEGAQANAPGTDEAGPSFYPDSGPHWEETHVDVSALVPYRSHPSFDLQSGVADQSSHERPPGPSPFYVYGGMPTESPDVMPTAAYYVSSPMMESTLNPDPQQQLEPLPPHQLRDRPLRQPQHYTPGSDALPRRGRGRRR